jgi:hypothetical protein
VTFVVKCLRKTAETLVQTAFPLGYMIHMTLKPYTILDDESLQISLFAKNNN